MSEPLDKSPPTSWARVMATRGTGPEARAALETLLQRYWPAVYDSVRCAGRREEEAEDLTQEFLLKVHEKGILAQADPGQGRLRNFLKTCLLRFLRDRKTADKAQKRGGLVRITRLDLDREERWISASRETDPAQAFDQAWARQVFDAAIATLSDKEKEVYRLHYGPAGLTLKEVAKRLDLSEGSVKSLCAKLLSNLRAEVHKTVEPTEFSAEYAAVLSRLIGG